MKQAVVLFALGAMFLMCDGRHAHSEERRNEINMSTSMQRQSQSKRINDASMARRRMGMEMENEGLQNLEREGKQRQFWPLTPVENENPRMREEYEEMMSENKHREAMMKARNQLRWNNLMSRKMQLRGSGEAEGSDESFEIRNAQAVQHNSSPENTGKGRQVVNHSRPRSQQATRENDSQEMINRIYRH